MFRIAAILAGVGARAAQGNASSAIARRVHSTPPPPSILRALHLLYAAIWAPR